MADIKRFEMGMGPATGGWIEPEEDEAGEWVKYEDHAKEVKRLKGELDDVALEHTRRCERLEREIERLCGERNRLEKDIALRTSGKSWGLDRYGTARSED